MLRKHFAPTPPSADARSVKRVSLEEEIILIDKANQDAVSADDGLCYTERLLDLGGALEDLAVIGDSIEKATPLELDLIDACAQMAVAGTDMPPEVLLRGPELAVGQAIATEGWKETANNVWKSIKAFVKKIWGHIEQFFKVHVVLPTMYSRLQLSLRQLKNRTGQLKYGAKPEVDLDVGLNYFFNGQKMASDTGTFSQELTKFGKAVDLVYVQNAKRVADLGNVLAQIIEDWDGKDYQTTDRTLEKMRQELSKQRPLNFSVPMPITTTQGDFKQFSSHEVLGGVYFQYLLFEDKPSVTPLVALDHFRRSGLTMLNGDESEEETLHFKHGPAAQYEKIIKDISDYIQVIARFNKSGGAFSELKRAADNLERASEHAIRQEQNGGDKSDVMIAYFRSMLNFNPAYARWVQQPAVMFYTKVIGLTRAILMLVAHYNRVYEVKDKNEEQKIMGEMQASAH